MIEQRGSPVNEKLGLDYAEKKSRETSPQYSRQQLYKNIIYGRRNAPLNISSKVLSKSRDKIAVKQDQGAPLKKLTSTPLSPSPGPNQGRQMGYINLSLQLGAADDFKSTIPLSSH